MLAFLGGAVNYHGVYSHFMNSRTGATVPLFPKDDGGDLVETSFLVMGLLCAREYFERDSQREKALRDRIDALWQRVEWDWYTRRPRSRCTGIGVRTTAGHWIMRSAAGTSA